MFAIPWRLSAGYGLGLVVGFFKGLYPAYVSASLQAAIDAHDAEVCASVPLHSTLYRRACEEALQRHNQRFVWHWWSAVNSKLPWCFFFDCPASIAKDSAQEMVFQLCVAALLSPLLMQFLKYIHVRHKSKKA